MKYSEIEKRAGGLASILICAAFAAVALWLFLRYGLSIILPFAIGWAIALVISPVAKKLAGKRSRTKKFLSVLFLVLLIAAVCLVIFLTFDRLVYETKRLIERLGDESAGITRAVNNVLDFFEDMASRIPLLDKLSDADTGGALRDKIDSVVADILSGAAVKLTAFIPKFIGTMIKGFPSFLLFVLVMLISSFYFCTDLDGIHRGIMRALPNCVSDKLPPVKKRVIYTALKYLRAYILIFLMTLGELLVGFCVLGVDYALLLALVVAVIDILPVFGVGSVLIPWSVVMLISGNYYRGIGLLIIYACITVIRQIAEPKVVGGSIGLHPLLTLVAMYAGFKLLGIVGMILGPVIALGVSTVVKAKRDGDSDGDGSGDRDGNAGYPEAGDTGRAKKA